MEANLLSGDSGSVLELAFSLMDITPPYNQVMDYIIYLIETIVGMTVIKRDYKVSNLPIKKQELII